MEVLYYGVMPVQGHLPTELSFLLTKTKLVPSCANRNSYLVPTLQLPSPAVTKTTKDAIQQRYIVVSFLNNIEKRPCYTNLFIIVRFIRHYLGGANFLPYVRMYTHLAIGTNQMDSPRPLKYISENLPVSTQQLNCHYTTVVAILK